MIDIKDFITDARVLERFWSKVDKKDSECWEWVGAKNKKGYGLFFLKKKRPKIFLVQTHRFSYMVANPQTPIDGLLILHSCDNPSCVNPLHLRAGTNQENVDDRVARNRSSGGGGFHQNKNWKRNNGRFSA